MTGPRKPPPGGRWVTLPNGERRVELVIEVDGNLGTGARRQTRRRFRTMQEAHDAYAETRAAVKAGTHVAKSHESLAVSAETWLAGKRNLKTSTRAGYAHALEPVLLVYGAQPAQKLTKAQLDKLVGKLVAGTAPRSKGKSGEERKRRPWSGRSVALTLFVLGQVLDDLIAQGRLVRNVANLVERPRHRPAESLTWTIDEVRRVLAVARTDRDEVAWLLALYGLRRGEVAGLRWQDVDLDAGTLIVGEVTRLAVNGEVVEDDAKSEAGHRTLPLTPSLTRAFKDLRRRHAGERLAIGAAYTDSGFVIVDEAGNALNPETLSSRFDRLVATAKVPRIRLHDARHTCGTLMHLAGEPIAVISAWLGHSSAAFTMRSYVHSQNDALNALAVTLESVFESEGVTSA
jgi:integrase